ncbi:hypothetical protein [Rhizobium leguminosarum]|uniref:hypothetical protein n=1 Tax=Rhizobium leguminosarum TaxID=384 RepID=UPI0021BBDAFB|nr:hypothetical protein [Rhizobium leguminosarum]
MTSTEVLGPEVTRLGRDGRCAHHRHPAVLPLLAIRSALRKVVRKRRDYSTEQIRQIAGQIFYSVLEVVPEIEDLTGFQKRNAALAKAAAQTANDQMLELCNLMGILFLTMVRPSDLATAKFEHFELETLVWHKHNTKGIKLSRAAYEYAYRSVPIHSLVVQMVRAQRARGMRTGIPVAR